MYATAADVRLVVARDPFRGQSAANLQDDQINQQIANAQAEVDGRLRRRYTVPFLAPIPALVTAVTVDIAAYLVALTYYQETELLADDPLMQRYNRAIQLLKDVTCGDIDLDAGDGALPGPDTGGGMGKPVNSYTGSLFGPCDFGLGPGWGSQSWEWFHQ